jgi:RNA polymerase sigma-70 factor (ECF subfamily)
MTNVLTGYSQAVHEESLVSAAKRGHQAAFGALFERHSKRVFHTMLRITKNREDAEDALQDSLLSAFIHLGTFDGRSSFSTWLTRIAINSALMKLRKNRGSREVSMDESTGMGDASPRFEPVDSHPDPEAHYAQGERRRIVVGAIRALRSNLREVVEIRELQEGSLRETAERLGISVAAAKARLFHAKAALRKSPKLMLFRKSRGRKATMPFVTARRVSETRGYQASAKLSGARALVA